MKNIKLLVKEYKNFTVIISSILLLGIIICIPTLAKLKNRNSIYSVSSWDGTIATSYQKGDGTEDNPYIISNGAEFAYFVEELKQTDYENTYFELSNDIIINPGIFDYNEETGIEYTLNEMAYSIKEYTNEYYDNENNLIGTINTFAPIKNFKGNFNGKSFIIFGLYIIDSSKENLALFETLEGNISDLYISNSVAYGGGNVAGIAVNANNAILKNISYNGNVINTSPTKTSENGIAEIVITTTLTETTEVVTLPQFSLDSSINSIKITGSYESSDDASINSIKINGIEALKTQNETEPLEKTFEINLGTTILSEIPFAVSSNVEGTTVTFSNIKYIVEYYDDITAGIVANSTNTILNNVINKSDVTGEYLAAGVVAKSTGSLQLTQSYNVGSVTSNYISSGIVGMIKNNSDQTTITNVYNKGIISNNISGGILGLVQDNVGTINIKNTINTSDNYAINTIINSIVNVESSYSVNGLSVYNDSLTNVFEQTAIENLYTKEFMTKISYNEFISFEDVETYESNAWIYENDSMPILYIDDLNNPIANINLNKYSWNNLSSELDIINVETIATFTIESVSATNPIKEKYYYVTNSRVALTEQDLDEIANWKSYDDAVQIEDSGYYVIYAKIVDSENKITYMNTDIIALNISGFQTNISMGDKVWDSFKTNLEDLYINKDINLNIIAQDDLFSITSVQYYLSNKELTEEETKNITDWITYSDNISITTPGKYIIYAKIVNGEGKVKYINTDCLLYNGYTEVINLGNIGVNYEANYITNKSSINLTFESGFELEYKDGYTHNLISNMLLPVGTKITLIDKVNNKIYQLKIDSEEDLYGYSDSCIGVSNCSKYATYKFELFKEIGTLNELNYDESINYNKVLKDEKFVITIDFKDTILVDNYYDLSFYLAIKNSLGEYLYKTLDNTINNINIYSTIDNSSVLTTHALTSDYANQIVYYNSNSETNINFTNLVTYSAINNKNVIDTTYESKKSGILINLYNQDGEVVNKQYLDNMLFELNGKEYFASSNNSIKINLGSVVDNNIKTLKIKTKENSSGLTNGTYYIKINKFISNDGYYYESLYSDEIVIPLVVENQTEELPNYSFDVQMNNESMVIDKELETHLASFNIVYLGGLINPSVKISLYEKNELTAYNQDYKIVDLLEYSSDTLTSTGSKQYLIDVSNSTFNLNLIPNKLNNNGYKYVFELYDGTKKIIKIEKYFIVN